MRRTMNLWVVLSVAACLLTAFFIYSANLQKSVDELDGVYEEQKLRVTDLRNEQTALNETLKTAGTDSFVENQARTLYGYMMPDEIRFVITNPEALYGDEEVPSR